MINAIELPTDAVGRTIEFETVVAYDYHAMKFGVEFGEKITVRGTVVDVIRKTQLTGRAVVTVIIECTDTDGEPFTTQFNLGSHNRFEYVEEDSEPGMASIADMPEPGTDEVTCDMDGCVATATHVALDIDGETKIPVCTVDSYNTRFWGVWPIENDDQFGAAVGGPDSDDVPVGSDRPKPAWHGSIKSPIVRAEILASNGRITPEKRDAVVNEIARLARVRRARMGVDSAPVSLDKMFSHA
jgi:hypothetical protein